MKRRSGEAQAALGRRAPVMRHRLSPRGGQRNEQADLMEEALQEHGLQQPFSDSATLVEDCPDVDGVSCKHQYETTCNLPSQGFNPEACPYLGLECIDSDDSHDSCIEEAIDRDCRDYTDGPLDNNYEDDY